MRWLFVLALVACKQDPVAKIQDFKDRMCACKDEACADAVFKEHKAWVKEHEHDALDPEQKKQFVQITADMSDCEATLSRALHPR